MRKMLATTVALESIVNPVITGLISLEEEQLLLGEASELGNEISNDLGEVDRLAETSDVLEDLAVIADGISNATPTEIDLLNAAGSMAVTGTDIPSEELIPAMESFKGKKIAIENFTAKAKTIWENIQKFVKKIWDNITLFFKKIFATLPNLQKRVADAKAAVEKVEGKNEEKSVTISAGTAGMTVSGVAVKNESDYHAKFVDLAKANVYALKTLPAQTVTFGLAIASGISEFHPVEAEASANKFVTEIETAAKPFVDAKVQNFLGNVTILPGEFPLNLGTKDLLSKLETYKTVTSKIAPSDKPAPSSIEITPLTTDGIKTLLKEAEAILKTMEDFYKTNQKSMETTRKAIESASEKATASFKSNQETKGAEAYYRAMLNYNQTYAAMVTSPATKMISNNVSCINVLLMVVNKSLAGYKQTTAVAVV
jgi:hypothetical protein